MAGPRIDIADVFRSDADGEGAVTIEVADTSGRRLTLVLADRHLQVLIAFLTATYGESLSKQAAARQARPFAVTAFELGRAGDVAILRIHTADGLPFDFAVPPDRDVGAIERLMRAAWAPDPGSSR